MYDYVDTNIGKKMIAAIGLRKILMHEYVRIDVEKLYGFLSLSDDVSRFIKAIHEYL